jgi:hypothetical protein
VIDAPPSSGGRWSELVRYCAYARARKTTPMRWPVGSIIADTLTDLLSFHPARTSVRELTLCTMKGDPGHRDGISSASLVYSAVREILCRREPRVPGKKCFHRVGQSCLTTDMIRIALSGINEIGIVRFISSGHAFAIIRSERPLNGILRPA